MDGRESCPECGVPEYITGEFLWLDSGAIVQRRDPGHRVVFVECEHLDPVFSGIGQIMGFPVEPLIAESRRRGARDYILPFISDEMREAIRRRDLELAPIVEAQLRSTEIMGFGKTGLLELSYEEGEGDFIRIEVREPYSVPLWCGSLAGACEAVVGGQWEADCERIAADAIIIHARRCGRPPDTETRPARREYPYRGGGAELERCGACGGPAALSTFRWHRQRGIISNAFTDTRVSINGETGLQDVFSEMERELGGAVSSAAIEAERRFIHGHFVSIEAILGSGDFRTQFAMRGLGDLVDLRMGATGLVMRLRDATLHLMVAGFAQALYEMAFKRDSRVEWRVDASGELSLEVTPVP